MNPSEAPNPLRDQSQPESHVAPDPFAPATPPSPPAPVAPKPKRSILIKVILTVGLLVVAAFVSLATPFALLIGGCSAARNQVFSRTEEVKSELASIKPFTDRSVVATEQTLTQQDGDCFDSMPAVFTGITYKRISTPAGPTYDAVEKELISHGYTRDEENNYGPCINTTFRKNDLQMSVRFTCGQDGYGGEWRNSTVSDAKLYLSLYWERKT